MRRVVLGERFEDFRKVARVLLALQVPPREVAFAPPEGMQLGLEVPVPEPLPTPTAEALAAVRFPGALLALAETVAAHRDPGRWSLLYEVLFRVAHGERTLMNDPTSAPMLALERMRKSVQRDVHKTHAFVRFRRVEREGVEYFIAWHEPQHRSLALAAPHFVRRFASMRWTLMTPDATASWDLTTLTFSPGVTRAHAPTEDALEDLWLSYYRSIFNPARLNVRAMRAELPRRHWATLPEAALISPLVRAAPRRTGGMVRGPEPSPASYQVPVGGSLSDLRASASRCSICPWAQAATQTVFGVGPARASVMLVGEQPGDREDLEGLPFVGPSGALLNRVLAEVGLPREELYVTNAVKHFKFQRDGKQRIHEKPSAGDVHACRGWLEAEVRSVQPSIIVALGATAGQAFLGPTFRLIRSRGQFLETPWTPRWMATYHPSALLRMPDAAAKHQAEAHFRADLLQVAEAWRALPGAEAAVH